MARNQSRSQRRRNKHQAGAAATPHLRHQHQHQIEPRIRCTDCLIEYPQTFFDKVDRKKHAPRPICRPCKTNAIIDNSELQMLCDEYQYRNDHVEDQDEGPIVLYDEQLDDEAFHRDFEDLDAEERRSKLHASRQFADLTIKYLSAARLAESRLRLRRRIRTPNERMLEQEILRFRWLAERLPLMSQHDRLKREQQLVQIRPIYNIADMQLETDLLPHAQFLLSLDLDAASGDNDESQADNIDDELERATELLALMRLPERDAIEQAQLNRERQLVSTQNRDDLRHQSQVAHQLAQQDGDALAQILQRSLALTDDDRSSEPAKAPPTFTAVANLAAVKARLATSNNITATTTTSSSSLSPAPSGRLRPGADSPAPSPRPTKRPRNQRETPVDPRLEMFERRLQARLRLQNESNPTPGPA